VLVDHHAHWLPGEVLEMLAGRTQPPLAARTVNGWLLTAALRPRLLSSGLLDLAERTRYLDSIGVARQCLSLSPLWNIEGQPLGVAMPLVRAFNDGLARAVATHTRYEGWACVPSADIPAACEELRRAAAAGLTGVVLPAPILATAARAEQWSDLFCIAESRRMKVFVHPGYDTPPDTPLPQDERHPWHTRAGLEPQHQLGSAMLALCQSGWVARFPRLQVQFANLGGSFPGALERLERMGEDTLESRRERNRALRQVTVDSASMGARSIHYVRELLGGDAVVFGTDMPIFDAARAAVDFRRGSQDRAHSFC
jgi:predicted TIM-barrel fold metal-dependent hydrolase